MRFLYTSNLEISEFGDVKMIINGDNQEFQFFTGLMDVVLPTFFSNLVSLIEEDINSFTVDGYDTMTKYKFVRNGNDLNIKYKYRHIQESYKFSLEMFLKAVQKAFKGHFRQQRVMGTTEENKNIVYAWEEFNKSMKVFN